jgi:signal transduction histidine kinase
MKFLWRLKSGPSEGTHEKENGGSCENTSPTQVHGIFTAKLKLRNPLNSIVGFTELMYHEKVDPKNLKEYYGDILSSSKYLLQMIEDMIDMSQLESEKPHIHPENTNLHLLCDEIKTMFDAQIKEKKLEWNCNIDSSLNHIVTDPIKLKQILRHYVSNAIKFTSDGGKIEIRINPAGNDQFQVEVIDTGIGISEEDLKKLFIPFQQLDTSMSKKYQGTGLGLALTRRIVELQGGKVGVKSNLGKGSTFSAVLPRIYRQKDL